MGLPTLPWRWWGTDLGEEVFESSSTLWGNTVWACRGDSVLVNKDLLGIFFFFSFFTTHNLNWSHGRGPDEPTLWFVFCPFQNETGWDLGPFTCFHLDKGLLQDLNTKKLERSKNNYMHGYRGKLWTGYKKAKTQLPLLRGQERKQGATHTPCTHPLPSFQGPAHHPLRE